MSRSRVPRLSVIVIFHNMRREAKRTLFSLTPAYQQRIHADEYEVIAIDNASSDPLDNRDVEALGSNFRYIFHHTSSVSPVAAVNLGVDLARGEHVVVCIDGARILSPRILYYVSRAFRAFASPFVATIGWHLGTDLQNVSMLQGYDQAVEDRLLDSVEWQTDGYALFSIATLAMSCPGSWFSSITESNCFAMVKREFVELGGFHPGFEQPGGGLVNLDFFSLACQAPHLEPVVLLGEGTFHQFHGGVATNVPFHEHPSARFEEEYLRIRAKPYAPPIFAPHFIGHLAPAARRFVLPVG